MSCLKKKSAHACARACGRVCTLDAGIWRWPKFPSSRSSSQCFSFSENVFETAGDCLDSCPEGTTLSWVCTRWDFGLVNLRLQSTQWFLLVNIWMIWYWRFYTTVSYTYGKKRLTCYHSHSAQVPSQALMALAVVSMILQTRVCYMSSLTCLQTFSAVLFVKDKNGKWLKCPAVTSG